MKIRTLFIIIVPLSLLAIALALGSILFLRLFSLAALTLVLSYLWSSLGVRGITAQVQRTSERCQVGEHFEEEITVSSSSGLPRFLIKAEENTELPEYHNAAVFNLPAKGFYEWKSQVHCRRRGLYTAGGLTVTAADPFGFFSCKRTLGESQNILIYPQTLELPLFQPLSQDEPGSGPSRWLSNEIGPNAARVREYTNGDTLNRIHWRSTAHTGKLMVKEFDADRSNNTYKHIWIILDMHQASQAGHGDNGTEECAVTIAASLVKKYVDSDQPVGLIASGDQPYVFPPDTGDEHLWKTLEALALMKAAGAVPIEQLISQEMHRFDSSSAVIVITPSATERLAAPLRPAINRGAAVIIISLDQSSFGGTDRPFNATSSLVSSGCRVYVVRHGDELARALDSRALVFQRR